MSGCLRAIATPFLVRPPAGTRVRTRLHVSTVDRAVLRHVGVHLGRLAGRDLAERCRLGLGYDERARRKQLLTGASSSRWAGAITRSSQDQWQLAYRNLLDEQATLRRAIRRLRARLAAPVGGQAGRVRGYANRSERWEKQRRLHQLMARLTRVEDRIAQGQVKVVRGGRRLLHARHQFDGSLATSQWRQRWEAARWFLTADGDAEYPLGNGTILVHPVEGWMELRLPAPLVSLANRPHGRYRMSCSVTFSHRADEWAAQVASGAVRYDITYRPERDRWYLDASWAHARRPVPTLAGLTGVPRIAVDLNAGHLDCWTIDRSGNPVGQPATIPLLLDGAPSTTRDGRLRAAISQLIAMAKVHGCRVIAIEDLQFADARAEGRETLGRGRRGKRVRRTIAGIPTGRFRDRLTQMCTNQGLWVVAVDPAYTSRWGREHWLAPMESKTPSATVTVHHAAAVVIGRRSLGHRARRRPGVPPPTGGWVSGRATDQAGHGPGRAQDPTRPRGTPASRLGCKTGRGNRQRARVQVAEDRSRPPVNRCRRLTPQER
jgi:hypothetical protein